MVDFKNIEKNVRLIIASQLGISIDNVKIDSKIKEDLGASSLDIIDFLLSIEDFFVIEILEHPYTKWNTVKDIIDYLKEKMLIQTIRIYRG